MKKVKFHFKLVDNSPLVLTYNLQDSSVVFKWISVVNQRKSEIPFVKKIIKDEPLVLTIQNKTQKDIPELIEKLNNIITQINTHYTQPFPLVDHNLITNQHILNYLHSEFEKYGEESTHGNLRTDLGQLWFRLNELIHITEDAIKNTNFPNFSCLIQYEPYNHQAGALHEEDKLFLETNFPWGGLYLGYNTLGKDYMNAFKDNDKRVILNNQVKIQKFLSPEVWLNFNEDNTSSNSHNVNFCKWWNSLDIGPITSISELALGRYYLGRLIFDKTFLKFHPVYKDWLIENSDIRRRWNLEVFGKIAKVTKIKIYE